MRSGRGIAWSLLLACVLSSCATGHTKNCSDAGQPAHEGPDVFKGTKKCFQVQDAEKKWVNHGKYFEWFTNEKISVVGEYEMGKKSGRWQEYDPDGKKIADKYYKDGKEIPAP